MMFPAFTEQGHAAVIQPDAAHDDLDGLCLPLGVECPDFGKTYVPLTKILLVLPKPLLDGMGHVGAHVTGPQFFERTSINDFQCLAVAPQNPLVIEVKDPQGRVQPVVNRRY